VSFALVHAGQYRTEDKPKTDTLQKLNTTQTRKLCYSKDDRAMRAI